MDSLPLCSKGMERPLGIKLPARAEAVKAIEHLQLRLKNNASFISRSLGVGGLTLVIKGGRTRNSKAKVLRDLVRDPREPQRARLRVKAKARVLKVIPKVSLRRQLQRKSSLMMR